MMHKRLSALVLMAVLSMTACKKDDYTQPLPQITDNGLANGKASFIAGDSLKLYPKLNERINTTYQWQLNSKQVSTDSVYTFKTDSAGTYIIQFTATNTSGQISTQYEVQVYGKYENGILIVNEGWFGHENGSVNFYRYGADFIDTMVYHSSNPGAALGVTTQYGAVHNGKLYLVSKQGPLVVTDARSLKETGRIATLPANGRAFVGLDNNNGLISTASGIYKLDLNSLAVGDKIPNADGQIGAMRVAGDYLFIISQSKGLLILRKSDYSLVKNIAGMNQGLSQTPDGALWVAGGSNLVKVNTSTLDTNRIVLPFSIGSPWSAWNVGTITTSSTENAVFIAQTLSWGAGGTKLYKYKTGDITSVAAPIATLPTGKEFYGGAVGYYAAKDELVVTAVQSGYGQNYKYNSLYFYDAANGNLKKTINYEHFYFPALMIFN